MFTKMTGTPTCFLPGHTLILQGTVQLDDASRVLLSNLETDEIGARAHNNFLDEYFETFPSKHC